MTKVLVINKSDLFDVEPTGDIVISNDSKLFTLTPFLVERDLCETDESLLQIIPYITLFDPGSEQIFIYTRGKQNGDSRLTGKCSVGLGGHIELAPSDTMNFLEVIIRETARELIEETTLTEDDFDRLVDIIGFTLKSGNFKLIYSDIDAVSRVHLGLTFVYNTNSRTLTGDEENVITEENWQTLSEIHELASNGSIELEHWSKIILGL